MQKPEIKGRGFVGSGKEIIEVQTYYTTPESDWIFDETLKATYNNPVFLEQKKLRNETIDDSGFIPQKPLDEQSTEELVDDILEDEDINEDERFDEEDFDEEDLDDDDFDEEDIFEKDKKSSIDFKLSSGKSVEVQMSAEENKSIEQEEVIIKSRPRLKLNIPEKTQEKEKIRFKL